MTAVSINEHVARDRVIDFDYYNVPGVEDDHILAWKALHNGPPNSTFASGPHRCPGSFLARTDFSIKPGERPKLHSGSVVSICYLPLVWQPR